MLRIQAAVLSLLTCLACLWLVAPATPSGGSPSPGLMKAHDLIAMLALTDVRSGLPGQARARWAAERLQTLHRLEPILGLVTWPDRLPGSSGRLLPVHSPEPL